MAEPTPVSVVSPVPIPVEVVKTTGVGTPSLATPPSPEPSKAPTTTSEQDLLTANQRQINMIWERTQASIAIVIVIANIAYIFLLLFFRDVTNAATNAATLLGNGFFLIVGFYFGRTNHARMGDNPNRHLIDNRD